MFQILGKLTNSGNTRRENPTPLVSVGKTEKLIKINRSAYEGMGMVMGLNRVGVRVANLDGEQIVVLFKTGWEHTKEENGDFSKNSQEVYQYNILDGDGNPINERGQKLGKAGKATTTGQFSSQEAWEVLRKEGKDVDKYKVVGILEGEEEELLKMPAFDEEGNELEDTFITFYRLEAYEPESEEGDLDEEGED